MTNYKRVTSTIVMDSSISRGVDAILGQQKEDGHWIYELEANVTFPSQYILLLHYLGETPETTIERKLARYIRRHQLQDGGWPLYTDGPMDISPSVHAYFALKMAGDSPDAEHMVRARRAILAAGGAEAASVFTRIHLALFGVLTWDAVPIMPIEIMKLPKWFPFHLSKLAYWARCTMVPLLVIMVKRPVARRSVRIDELFNTLPETVGLTSRAPHQNIGWFEFFRGLDVVLRRIHPLMPPGLQQRATDMAVAFVDERLNGEDGLGAIIPAIFYSIIMYDTLGNRTSRDIARGALDRLLIIRGDEAYCQTVMSATWDTVLAAWALLETRTPRAEEAAKRGLHWLRRRQILDVRGDWISQRPKLRPGGWAFYYNCPYYPDVDDTAVIAMAMHHADPKAFAESIARARDWVVGMQSKNGGWGSYDADNTHLHLNNIPFSDHGALLDPPTADVTARCLSMMCQLGVPPTESKAALRAFKFVSDSQEKDGSWLGDWGVNYIYGTWSALSGLNAAGLAHDDPRIQRAVGWLLAVQNGDGGWGESASSYEFEYARYVPAPSTATQTAWALLGLMAAGEVENTAVRRGVTWLLERQQEHGLWDEALYTGTAFPRVLYLRYHGYARYFPLWALARYRDLTSSNRHRVTLGM
nr:PREDICTED: uncharacterized protein LOC109030518 [Bemisia tabaci]